MAGNDTRFMRFVPEYPSSAATGAAQCDPGVSGGL